MATSRKNPYTRIARIAERIEGVFLITFSALFVLSVLAIIAGGVVVAWVDFGMGPWALLGPPVGVALFLGFVLGWGWTLDTLGTLWRRAERNWERKRSSHE